MKYLICQNPITKESLAKLPLEFELKTFNDFYIIYEKGLSLIEDENSIALIDGYVVDHDSQGTKDIQTHNFLKHLCSNWPMAENFSGSFSISLIDKRENRLISCNDPVGPYPLYYLKSKKTVIAVSNNILCLGWIFDLEKDEVGIYQRLVGPELSNIGSRTILKNVKRLLPGEKIIFKNSTHTHQFDNTLYSKLGSKNSNLPYEAKNLHNLITKEIDYLTKSADEINLALSGGLDSRILLSAIKEQNLNCLTYGNAKYYETKLAKKLAKKKKATFRNFDDKKYIFPEPHLLEKYVLETESVFITNWLAILENTETKKNRNYLLIGDMCESIPGRNIGKFNSKSMRKKTFLKTHFLKNDFEFTKNSVNDFHNWKEQIIKRFMFFYQPISLQNSNFVISIEELHKELNKDLNELFDRISAHKLPYIELLEELFKWYTHSRSGMNNQLTLCNRKFKSLSPTMGMKLLRCTSNINPNLRLGNRLMDAILKTNKSNKTLILIPTSQAPFVSQNAPKFFKFLSWGMRSYIDSFLIKRIMRNKNPKLRYRLLPSHNWVKTYIDEKNLEKFQDYFSNKEIGEIWYNKLVKNFNSKRKLETWPFTNTVFISASALNKELELIKNFKTTQDLIKDNNT
ncbi:N-terminal nucleophile aminohydrolase [Zunongwangia profunda SM-A87]|uniref:asparagine synthase (glutamine-hydrolyzing) n=1 Tax=Zunongwangia profunda (strain DSM 18752 / CCTCC AB 206139 / SM-A87) TaxID=655815 RepID=D5BIM3_ZUNPS|nr:nucleophile aminohydrolase [Zunongwangia profunda]ADF51475.1 N-terminal nucleophile aminohydrolase [Zunongwangia profunda SM-A87]